MRKLFAALALLVITAWAANIRLYMKDGSYHLVREYQVQSDRVRFYSVERGAWEEMPLDLIDLDKTRGEEAERKAEVEKETKALSEEDQAERQLQKEVMQIPQNPGVYWMEGGKAKALPVAESTVHTNKGRAVLQKLAPVPVVSGKATLELNNPRSTNIFTNREQEFYFQLSDLERFGIWKLKPKGPVRIVENLTYMPVTKEIVEEPEAVEILQQQLTPDGLYKIWPKEPLEPGEYAIVEYTDGKVNVQVWDFAIKAAK
jgi:hypothetical protein